MVRHPTSRRVHRKHAATDDVFVEGVLESTAWMKEHARTLITAVATVILVLAGYFYYQHVGSARDARALVDLTQVRQTVQSGNTTLAIRDLQTYLERYGSTSSAREARMMLAQQYLDNNEPQKAIDTIRRDASNTADPVGTNAAFILAAAHEAANQPKDAETVYLRIADQAPYDYQKQQALDNAARIRTEQGNLAGAAQLYERILKALPDDDPQRPVVEMRLAEARARASSAPTPTTND